MNNTRDIKVLKLESQEEDKYTFLIGYGKGYSLQLFFETQDKNLLELEKEYLGKFVFSSGMPDFIGDGENEICTMSENLEKILDKYSGNILWEK